MTRSIIVATTFCLGMTATAAAEDLKTRGEKLFTEQKCVMCHSIGGVGNAKGPLDDVAARISPAEIRQWITNPKEMTEKTKPTRTPTMKEFNLPKKDVDALVAYLETMKGK